MGWLGSGMRHGVFVLSVVTLSACTAIYQNHGYVPRDDELAKVVVGESTREAVAETVGRPTSTGLLTGAAWYYVGSRFRQYGIRAPEEIEREVVAISFDEAGLVENVERFGLENGRAVVISRRVTDSNVKGLSFLRQLLGNVGNIDASQVLGEN
ncbi:outer membrane protein assembly factor BamE [Defluviimonas sp. D31]|uniref:outer membrane protein assembly factor BamE n=1 Tax=Defluviimonas sp. D31 TaxID=3083253 RepID=UPI00296EB0BE|nr:outer membrane protein assembly factor BamE [Defluviimonas sp. D31]MDW4548610.1 outer membrane protein assembly factor BamE [Defluviimonas sp. D31]